MWSLMRKIAQWIANKRQLLPLRKVAVLQKSVIHLEATSKSWVIRRPRKLMLILI